ncbi:autoinducer binding domain-containing protein [Burkholderia oklahomensis]|uniref:Autoinducer binding domain protein n=1 Tax=Burkholderia oklahomensis TaxID=342113 RepID=A0AAI8FR81_9BURK|nr:autoinducer binding domain-containing protein [Burkholderia oklahomensis]AIO70456.1 autoinducer binding domain protein [Burkholderia oklahomensis]AOI38620.1 transcriptional regulator [Burkholderia oklahomensis EO147]AOI48336.1 transcriptional regulator [Burkholderia oklahomensis C6786]KUY48257.1 transcriptional regulator [Burkholderia oklahomensis EO147]KUY52521.1 transcriptional regulator [Burkholderia oklahomensis C6786]
MARNRTVFPIERAQVDVAQERKGVVGDKQISLRVCGEAAQGYLLERHHAAPREPSFVQRVNLFDGATVASFIEHDPYSAELKSLYRAVIDVPENAQRSFEDKAIQPEFASECISESGLLTVMRNTISECGATNCFYHYFRIDEKTGNLKNHELLIGGTPVWAHRYVHRHWYLNDPAIAHARNDTRPLRVSTLATLPSDHWLNQQAQFLGLTSNVFFPAHRRDDDMIGLLHVSSPLPPAQGEEILWRNRRTLRGLATEMLEWKVTAQRQMLAREMSLNHRELVALRLVDRGGNARHVAEELKLEEHAVYQLFTSINKKMNSGHIKTSAKKAKQFGFLAEGYISE